MRCAFLLFPVLSALLLVPACGNDSRNDGAGGGTTTAQSDCQVCFAMTEGTLSSEFQAIFDYAQASGHFVGVNTAVECTRLDARMAIYGANQCTGPDGTCKAHDREEMYVVAQTTRPLSAPLQLLECRFVGSRAPEIGDFQLVDTFSTDADGASVDPPPTIAVTNVECRGPETTTTTLVEPDPCEAISCPEGNWCVAGECVETNHYVVELQTDAAALYAALQIDVGYDCSEGSFDGLGDKVACRPAPAINAYAAFNNTGCLEDGGSPTVTAGAISLLGWPGPGSFVSCDFTSVSGDPPSADAFRITVVDAWTVDDRAIQNATVSVSAIRPIAP